MALEQQYEEQMRSLGIWEDAFAAEVHTLSVMERELRRAQKRHKELLTNGLEKSADAVYTTILQLRRDILAHRDSLGLTPKGLQRLKGREGRAEKPVHAMDLAALSNAELEALAQKSEA